MRKINHELLIFFLRLFFLWFFWFFFVIIFVSPCYLFLFGPADHSYVETTTSLMLLWADVVVELN